jgi:hypothetical protein
MSVNIRTRGVKASQRYLSDLIRTTDDSLNDALQKVGDSIVAEARSNLQNNTNINSGTLLSSIRILDEGKNFIVIGTDLDYAEYIEYGRGPVIPINGEWLHWIDKQTGKDVFAKFAKAVEPMPFLEPAVISNTSKFQDIVAENVAQIGTPVGGND